jgi:hypothetical protein
MRLVFRKNTPKASTVGLFSAVFVMYPEDDLEIIWSANDVLFRLVSLERCSTTRDFALVLANCGV